MNSRSIVDLFAEDTAHEEFLKAVIQRLAKDAGKHVHIRTRSAKGGHGRAVAEYSLYQRVLKKSIDSGESPDLVVVAVDCNCTGHTARLREIRQAADEEFVDRTVFCCPDPHIERWYLLDIEAVRNAIGAAPRLTRKKCKRDYYKKLLGETVKAAGHPPSLGGIEFASDLVWMMDFYRAGKADKSLGLFIRDITAALRRLAASPNG